MTSQMENHILCDFNCYKTKVILFDSQIFYSIFLTNKSNIWTLLFQWIVLKLCNKAVRAEKEGVMFMDIRFEFLYFTRDRNN